MNIHSTPIACIIRHWYMKHRVSTFQSLCLLAAPQWRNALAGAAVVVMLLLKRRGGGITFHVFCSCAVTLTRWPIYTNLTRVPWRFTGWAKMNFVSHGLRKLSSDGQTNRETDTTEIITTAASRVVTTPIERNCK